MALRVDAMLEEARAKPVSVRQMWLEKLISQGREESTIQSYMRVLSMYLGTASEHPTFSTERVTQFLFRKSQSGVSSTSLRMYYYALKTLFEDFDEPWFTKSKPPPKSSKRSRPKLTEEEMDAIEAAAKAYGSKRHRIRNYALFRVSHTLGLRRIELHRMNISHVHLDHGHPEMGIEGPHVEVQTAKHGKFVIREIDEETARALKEWIRLRTRKRVPIGKRYYYGGTRDDPEPLWIAGVNGMRISKNSLGKVQVKVRHLAGVRKERAGFHAARRGRITGYHDGGATPSQITQEMGWEDETTVLGYIQPDMGSTKIKIRATNPRFRNDTNDANVKDKTVNHAPAPPDVPKSTLKPESAPKPESPKSTPKPELVKPQAAPPKPTTPTQTQQQSPRPSLLRRKPLPHEVAPQIEPKVETITMQKKKPQNIWRGDEPMTSLELTKPIQSLGQNEPNEREKMKQPDTTDLFNKLFYLEKRNTPQVENQGKAEKSTDRTLNEDPFTMLMNLKKNK